MTSISSIRNRLIFHIQWVHLCVYKHVSLFISLEKQYKQSLLWNGLLSIMSPLWLNVSRRVSRNNLFYHFAIFVYHNNSTLITVTNTDPVSSAFHWSDDVPLNGAEMPPNNWKSSKKSCPTTLLVSIPPWKFFSNQSQCDLINLQLYRYNECDLLQYSEYIVCPTLRRWHHYHQ